MRTQRLLPRTAWLCSLLLGQASVLLGLMVALGWLFAFAVIVSQKTSAWAAGPPATLPIEPPLVGLALGAAGLLLARWFHQPVARFSVAGLLLNALPLALAAALIVLHASR